jgi:hypothetical protein
VSTNRQRAHLLFSYKLPIYSSWGIEERGREDAALPYIIIYVYYIGLERIIIPHTN